MTMRATEATLRVARAALQRSPLRLRVRQGLAPKWHYTRNRYFAPITINALIERGWAVRIGDVVMAAPEPAT